MLGTAVVLGVFAAAALLLGLRRWLDHRRYAALAHLAGAAALGWLALGTWDLGRGLAAYEPRIDGRPVAEIAFERIAPGRFRATLTRLPGGRMQVFGMQGEQWRIEARLLDWQGRALALGPVPRYRLEQLESRRTGDPAQPQGPCCSRYALARHDGPDPWQAAGERRILARAIVPGRAASPYAAMEDGAVFRVTPKRGALEIERLGDAAGPGQPDPR